MGGCFATEQRQQVEVHLQTPPTEHPQAPEQQPSQAAGTTDPEARAMPAPYSKADRSTAEKIKNDGNVLFKKGKFSAAIDLYTEALLHAPDMHVVYVNRAMSYLKLGKWENCEQDARNALAIQSGLIKGHYCLGVALRHQVRYKDSCKHLEKALSAAFEVQDSIKDSIWRELAACKHALWQQQATIREDKRHRLQNRISMFMDAYFLQHPEDEGRERDEKDMGEMLQQLQTRDEAGDADFVFTCGLTMEPFRDPVITPDGNSYERAALIEHLHKVGQFEPVTRRPLDVAQLISNTRLREATQQYLDDHPWAWGECVS